MNSNLSFSFANISVGYLLADISGTTADLLIIGGTLNLDGIIDILQVQGDLQICKRHVCRYRDRPEDRPAAPSLSTCWK